MSIFIIDESKYTTDDPNCYISSFKLSETTSINPGLIFFGCPNPSDLRIECRTV